MTRKEAIENLKGLLESTYVDSFEDEENEALKIAINSLEIDERYELEYEQIEPCEDAISRQAVQDYIAKYLSQFLYDDVRQAVEVIDEYIGEMPPVKPQVICPSHGIDCEDCPAYEPKTDVLDKIRAEIDEQYKWLINTRYTICDIDIAFGSIFRFIDKYKAESEDK